MKKLIPIFTVAGLLAMVATSMPATTVALFIKANGVTIDGDSTIVSQGRDQSIECLFFENKVNTVRQAGTGLATGRRQYEPILIRKRIDKSSPQLAKALGSNEVIEAAFRFYRTSPNGSSEHYFTVEIKQARVSSLRHYLPDTQVAATTSLPPMEEVSFVFPTIKYRYELTGAEYEDSSGVGRGTTLSPLGSTRIVPPPLFLYLIPGFQEIL